MINTIIFDYDGVIIDSFMTVYETYKLICAKMSLKIPNSPSDFKSIYGFDSNEYFKNLGLDKNKSENIRKLFREEIIKKNPLPFKGVNNVLKELSKNYVLIVLSSAYEDELYSKLEKYDLIKYFNLVIGRKHHTDLFSKKKFVEIIMHKYNLESENIVMIGDRNIDYLEAKKAGLKNTLIVDYGWGYSKSFVPEQKIIINSPKDIIRAIKITNEQKNVVQDAC